MTFIQALFGAIALASLTVYYLCEDVESLTRGQLVKGLAGSTAAWSAVLFLAFLLIDVVI